MGYFGSFADNEQNEDSDLDILVEFSKPIGWEFFSLEKFLEEALELKVDLVRKNAIKKHLKRKILDQVVFV
ncbi:MAG: nucleotidyltransferase domain-containing protein [Bacteroidetes bacterium]|nr:nucleotidyltransferase domain-containing protein [Bacteroidota bacterium]